MVKESIETNWIMKNKEFGRMVYILSGDKVILINQMETINFFTDYFDDSILFM